MSSLLDLRALLNEQHPHDAKPLIVVTADGARHAVTDLAVISDEVVLTVAPIRGE